MTHQGPEHDEFDNFSQSLACPDVWRRLREGLIGEDVAIPGPNGPNPIIYADYVASGRALRQIEGFIADKVLPFYANSHTEASFCGRKMTRMRQRARQIILNTCGGDDRHAVIFTGSGATAGLNRLVRLLGVDQQGPQGTQTLVLIGPYEHHSNILPWRESGAEVVEIPEACEGGPEMQLLEQQLASSRGRLVVGSFSAMSNVTGIVTDVVKVTRLLKSYGALSVWDYAGGGPYLPLDMNPDAETEIDAIVVSPHKFIGGPGASGVLILRCDVVSRATPTWPGGGTVSFVSPWGHDYVGDVVSREEAGTPNVIGDIRAALCFLVKDALGQDFVDTRLKELRHRALQIWSSTPGLHVLGNAQARHVLPIFSFLVENQKGGYAHPQEFTRMLSDLYGIQARGGCACAGPYGHRLLEIDRPTSDSLRKAVLEGRESEKPGWTRLGFSALMNDTKADRIIEAVDVLARQFNQETGRLNTNIPGNLVAEIA